MDYERLARLIETAVHEQQNCPPPFRAASVIECVVFDNFSYLIAALRIAAEVQEAEARRENQNASLPKGSLIRGRKT